ncbi:mechanosensitive ion channel family protein [Alteromonas sp. ASW11-130]|uniref:mechanosensitive ion channel family protein n=1 Tax=Alteromonas sp. ASW11-130 TaxID=3015775 RepID=UPI0022421B4A|nr:mechanosensitive ion channel family protein [Alteromonas sp. ASW11-130]MCW8092680.1 mechanosensitive ion channel family protein [Alteromonas sp. ASW11-130]
MSIASSVKNEFVELLQIFLPSLTTEDTLYNVIAVSTILTVAFILLMTLRVVLRPQIGNWVERTKNTWDDALYAHGFFRQLMHLIPAVIIYISTPVLIDEVGILRGFLIKASQIYMLFTALLAIYAVLNTLEDKYNESHLSQRASITGFVQVAKLFFAILVLLFSISLIIDKSPLIIVSGLTALAAVLILVFKDTIMGFVAGIQIAANRMFNTGDWIQIDKFGVDGEILELGLTNVKVQNWDKTISTIPSYSLVNEAVKNWRGMQLSGGRRIKRALHIDMYSVKLCNEEMLKRFSHIRYISEYVEEKIDELRAYHKDYSIDEADLLNTRKLTNIGTFRAYIEAYLAKHPKINQSLTVMVRQLPPSEYGLPLEVYCFSAEKAWVDYEKIQANIFDHLLAMMPLFDLRVFQRDAHLLTHSHSVTPSEQIKQEKGEPD